MYNQLQILHDARIEEFEKTSAQVKSSKARAALRGLFTEEMDTILDEEFQLRSHLYDLSGFGSNPPLGAGSKLPFEYPIMPSPDRKTNTWPADLVSIFDPKYDKQIWADYKKRLLRLNGPGVNPADAEVLPVPMIPPWPLPPFSLEGLLSFVASVYRRAFSMETMQNELLGKQRRDASLGAFVPSGSPSRATSRTSSVASRRGRQRAMLAGRTHGGDGERGRVLAEAGGPGVEGAPTGDAGEALLPMRHFVHKTLKEQYGCERIVAKAMLVAVSCFSNLSYLVCSFFFFPSLSVLLFCRAPLILSHLYALSLSLSSPPLPSLPLSFISSPPFSPSLFHLLFSA